MAVSVEPVDSCQAKIAPAFQSSHLVSSEVKNGLHGGQILEIKRMPLKPWKLRSSGSDKPGDFRWGPAFMGNGLKDFFSIHSYSKDLKNADYNMLLDSSVETISIPDIHEINGGLLKLKSILQAAGHPNDMLTFYKSDKIVSPLVFLIRLAENHELPMVITGELFEHDFNYHFLSSLVTPPQMVRLMANRAMVLLKFLEYAKQNAGQYKVLRKNFFARNFEAHSLPYAIVGLDLQGNHWMGYHNITDHNDRETLPTNLFQILRRSTNPRDYLKHVIQQSSIGPVFWNVLTFADEVNELVNQFCKDSPPEMCAEDVPLFWFNPGNPDFIRATTEHYHRLEKASLHQVK